MQGLKTSTQAEIEQCEQIQSDRDGFESSLSHLVAWFEDKEEMLATCGVLGLDSQLVSPVIDKHKVCNYSNQVC